MSLLGLGLQALTHEASCFYAGTMLAIWVAEKQYLDNGLVIHILFPKDGPTVRRHASIQIRHLDRASSDGHLLALYLVTLS